MQKESWKVFLACTFGAGIGSLVALQLSHWFWWVGLLVGGIVGYLSYEWKAVVQAVPHAFRAATKWRLPKLAFDQAFWMGALTWNFFTWICGQTLLLGANRAPHLSWTEAITLIVLFPVSLALLIAVIFLLAFTINPMEGSELPDIRKIAIATFPPVVIFWHIPRALVWFARKLPGAAQATCKWIVWAVGGFARFCKRFAWQMFIRIHSEKRLICGVDAMLGAAIGYMAHHAIIGALAGGIIGLINHAVVTERWLKPRGYISVKS